MVQKLPLSLTNAWRRPLSDGVAWVSHISDDVAGGEEKGDGREREAARRTAEHWGRNPTWHWQYYTARANKGLGRGYAVIGRGYCTMSTSPTSSSTTPPTSIHRWRTHTPWALVPSSKAPHPLKKFSVQLKGRGPSKGKGKHTRNTTCRSRTVVEQNIRHSRLQLFAPATLLHNETSLLAEWTRTGGNRGQHAQSGRGGGGLVKAEGREAMERNLRGDKKKRTEWWRVVNGEGSKNDDGGKDEELLTPVVVQPSFGWHVVLR
ncbi:hypothetical protein K438DRAFT_1755194 [Mycena galopus ATCC 62051]|nr:hypothetical protein K438DRAFT_1755194 [Mycena galopus ATCC 62051]